MERTIRKIFLDVAMLVLYLVLMFGRGLSPLFHEIAGIGIGILVVIHCVWNRGMFFGLKKRLQGGEGSWSEVLLYTSDLVLPLGMVITAVTGVLVSSELFSWNLGDGYFAVAVAHNMASYLTLGIIVLHGVCHAKYLVGVARAMRTGNGRRALLRTGKHAVALASLMMVLYGTFSYVYDKFAASSRLQGGSPAVVSAPAEDAADASSAGDADASAGDADATYGETLAEDAAPDALVEPEPETTEPEVTLEEYLSGLTCTGCHRGCSLLTPRCGKGERQAEEAQAAYEAAYQQ